MKRAKPPNKGEPAYALDAEPPLVSEPQYPHVQLPRKDYEECKRILKRDDVLLNELDYCYTHRRQCRRLPVVEGHGHLSVLVAGSPCPGFSAYGKRSRDLGKTGHLFVILKLGCCCNPHELALKRVGFRMI